MNGQMQRLAEHAEDHVNRWKQENHVKDHFVVYSENKDGVTQLDLHVLASSNESFAFIDCEGNDQLMQLSLRLEVENQFPKNDTRPGHSILLYTYLPDEAEIFNARRPSPGSDCQNDSANRRAS